MGSPPIKPEIAFPIPWAFNSLLVGDIFLSGSSLSVASTLNSVSILPTIAIVTAIIQTFGFVNPEKLGRVIKFLKSYCLSAVGRPTNCCLTRARDEPESPPNELKQ